MQCIHNNCNKQAIYNNLTLCREHRNGHKETDNISSYEPTTTTTTNTTYRPTEDTKNDFERMIIGNPIDKVIEMGKIHNFPIRICGNNGTLLSGDKKHMYRRCNVYVVDNIVTKVGRWG